MPVFRQIVFVGFFVLFSRFLSQKFLSLMQAGIEIRCMTNHLFAFMPLKAFLRFFVWKKPFVPVFAA